MEFHGSPLTRRVCDSYESDEPFIFEIVERLEMGLAVASYPHQCDIDRKVFHCGLSMPAK